MSKALCVYAGNARRGRGWRQAHRQKCDDAHEMERVVKSSADEATRADSRKRQRKCECACVLYGRLSLSLSPQQFLGLICLFDSERTVHVTLMAKEKVHSVHENNINHAEIP